MSSMSSPAPGGVVSAQPGLADTVMALVTFVQSPEYPGRVQELLQHEQAAQAAKSEADFAETAARERLAQLAKMAAEIDRKRSDFEARQAAVEQAQSERDASLSARELDVAAREKAHAESAALAAKATGQTRAELDALQTSLQRQDAELSARRAAVDQTAADLQRRLAKLREAAQ
jgi:uncharacterized protein YqcC (DUF446 family)